MVELFVTGDLCPHLRMQEVLTEGRYKEAVGFLAKAIDASDLAITNLECPITESHGKITKTGPHLKVPQAMAPAVQGMGFSLATLANNHIMDFGGTGLADTMEALDGVGVVYIGAGKNYTDASRAYRMDLNGLKVSILNFAENEWSTTLGDTPGACPIDPVRNFHAIKHEKQVSDHVLVISHGGHEMFSYPSPRMVELYRFYIDCGASVVINHHTHCISGYEKYKQGYIHYSLGNFLFDHPGHRDSVWNYGAAVSLRLTKSEVMAELHYFKQCGEEPGISELRENEKAAVQERVGQVNQALADMELLVKVYEEFSRKQGRLYRSYIEPVKFRVVNALQNRGLLPSFWSPRKKEYLLNLVRCESHKDQLIRILEDDVSDS